MINDNQRVAALEFNIHEARIVVRNEINSLLKRQANARARLEVKTVEDIHERLRRMSKLADRPKDLINFIKSPIADEEILDLRIFNDDNFDETIKFKKAVRIKGVKKKE